MYWYCKYVIEGEFPEIENIIMLDPDSAYLYAVHIKKERWIIAEQIIMTDIMNGYYYIRHFNKNNIWPELNNVNFTSRDVVQLFKEKIMKI